MIKLVLASILLVACSKSEGTRERKHEDRGHEQTSATAFSLAITIGDKHETWTAEAFAKVTHYASKNNSGQARDTWSLRDVASTLAGPTARVTKVTGADGAKEIDAAAWADPARVPIVHSTRRGTLKFRWAAADGKWGESEISDVSALEITP